MKYLIVIGLLGLLSFVSTYLIMRYLMKKRILDIPNERSLHNVPTPSGGGAAIVISWYIGITFLYFNGIIDKTLYSALMSGILVAIISLIDDIYGVKPYIRLIVHIITAVVALFMLNGLRPLIIPAINFNYDFIVYPLAIIGIVWFINLFNFMDGVDGFASVEAIFICSVYFVLTWNIATLLLIVCVGGFLSWNWPKAKIFMGDTGSTQLGFVLVVMGIYFHNNLEFSVINWIMLTSPFWFDATLTLFRRWRNGEKLSQAHKKHVYQRIVQAGFSHEKVNLFLILINLAIILMIVIYRGIKVLQIPLFIVTLVLFYFITKQVDKRVPFTKDEK
ncbi:MAG: glycosyltransferase family 4 protein [Bacteroidia bacterium]|nr:glycosyltransferase family 4 protein [Bacteroidia bacterium]